MSDGAGRARRARPNWPHVRAGICALLVATACHSWRPAPAAPDTVGTAPLARARIVKRDGSAVVLNAVQVRDDSVVGFAGAERARRAIARTDVARIETRLVSAGRTTLGVIGGVAVLYLVLYAIALNSVLTGWSEAAANR
jgi:hypothetical protein